MQPNAYNVCGVVDSVGMSETPTYNVCYILDMSEWNRIVNCTK